MENNFIHIKVKDPQLYEKQRLKSQNDGVRTIIGFMKEGGSEVQSIIFSKDKYDIEEAKNWTVEHGHNVQEVYLVNDIILNSSDKDIKFIEEVYHEKIIIEETIIENKNKYNYLLK
jgi:hypothetical protein